MIYGEVPVLPDAEEARRLAEAELAKSDYDYSTGFIYRALQRISNFLAETFSGMHAGPITSPWLILLLIVAIVVVTLVFFSRVRVTARSPQERTPSAVLFADDADSAELMKRAQAYLRQSEYTSAFLDLYRATIRHADERALIHDRPGLTAQEAASQVADLGSQYCRQFPRQANIFDAASYGDLVVSQQQVEALLRLDSLVRQEFATMRPRHDVGERL